MTVEWGVYIVNMYNGTKKQKASKKKEKKTHNKHHNPRENNTIKRKQ